MIIFKVSLQASLIEKLSSLLVFGTQTKNYSNNLRIYVMQQMAWHGMACVTNVICNIYIYIYTHTHIDIVVAISFASYFQFS